MKKIITLCVFMACPLQGMQRMKQLFARACAVGKVAFTKGDAAPQAESVKRVATRAALYSSAFTTGVAAGYCATSLKKSLVTGAPSISPMEKNLDMYISLSKTLQTLSADAPELLETAQESIENELCKYRLYFEEFNELEKIATKSPAHATVVFSALAKKNDLEKIMAIVANRPAMLDQAQPFICDILRKADFSLSNFVDTESYKSLQIILSGLEMQGDFETMERILCRIPGLFDKVEYIICNNIHKFSADLLGKLTEQSHKNATTIATIALKQLDNLDTLARIAAAHPAAFIILQQIICENIQKISHYALAHLARQSHKCATIIATATLQQIEDLDTLASIAAAHPAAFNILKEKFPMPQLQTVSTGYLHTTKHAWQLLPGVARYIQPYFKQVLEQEKALSEQGYTCLYHGQRSIYGFQEDFTRELLHELHQQGYVTEPLRPDFLYIQHRNKIAVHEEEAASIIKTAKEEQQDMMQGRKYYNEPARLPHRLSANLFLWGNLFNYGSCTVDYLADNTNVNKVLPPIKKDVFEKLQIPSSISMRYHAELTELQQLHASLFTKGRLLQIAVPTKILDEYVYLASPGACKTEVITKRGKAIYSPRDFLYKATTSPEEFETYNLDKGSEVAIPLTAAYALNPHSDIKIYAYDPEPQDAARYQEYIERRKALAHAIAQETAHHKSSRGKKLELCCKPLQEQFKESVKALKKED